jgi:tRNA (cmo5U34)-methyltransferase
MKTEVEGRFQEASQYDTMMARLFAAYEQLPLIVLSHLRARLPAKARVLDVGCGTGSAVGTFAAHQPDWSFVGVDPSAAMVDAARAKLASANLSDRVSWVAGTVDSLPDEAAFDAATALLVEHLLPDDGTKLRLLEGVRRRLVPGGSLLLASLHGDLGTATTQSALQAWLAFIALQGLPPESQAMVHRRATVEDSLVSEARIIELLQQAGFAGVERLYQVHLLGAWLASKAP